MPSPDLLAGVAATDAALRGDLHAIDAQLDLAGAARALAGDAPIWLRVAPPPGPATEGYLGVPAAWVWVRVKSAVATLEPLAVAGAVPAPALEARCVTVHHRDVEWGTSAAPLPKTIARVVLVTKDGVELDVASAIADDAARARGAVSALASALAARLAVPVEPALGEAAAPAGSPEHAEAEPGEIQDMRPLLRWTLGFEDDRMVLRDLASRGPRESAWIWSTVAIASGVGAVVTGLLFTQALRAEAPWQGLAARAGVGVVFALGAFAFFHVARHALRYRAAGTPIAVFADDRVVAYPWVSREGAVDPRPEGRFGAGVRIHEVDRVHVVEKSGRHVVSLDTQHGPIDITDADAPEQAQQLRVIVERSLASVTSARKRRAAPRAVAQATGVPAASPSE